MRVKPEVVLAVVVLSAIFLAAESVQAQWLSGWAHRRAVTIANSCGEGLADYPVRVLLDSSFDFSKAQADGSDLRLADGDGTTLIPFWIEEWNPGGEVASIWVNVPSMPMGVDSVYLYYGNSLATSVSDGEATFDVYDGFESWAGPNPGEWSRYAGNPLITEGPSGSWDDHGATFASVIWDETAGEFRMYYHGFAFSGAHQVGLATSLDALTWTKYAGNPVLTPGPTAWDNHSVRVPMVWKEGPSDYHMIYTGYNGSSYQVGYAYSSDGLSWTKHASNPVFNDPTWAHDETENWGVMKVGADYLMWYSDFGVRQSGIAVSTDLVNWSPYQPAPIFVSSGVPADDRYNQYCPFSFKYGSDYFVLVPSYDSSYNYSKYYLYRSSSPYFPEVDRHLVRVAHTVGGDGEWDDHDSDTPYVFTLDIERTVFYNDELWCYYAGEGGANLWKEGLHLETDIAAALSDAPLPGTTGIWTLSGDVTVVSDPVHQGSAGIRQHDTSSGSATQLSGTFPAKDPGVVGAWMRRNSTSFGDYDVYLYGDTGATLSCVAGLGRDGDFHYWNGSFQPTGVSWAVDTWYLVSLAFDATTDRYDFVVYDQNNAELVREEGIAFGNPAPSIDRAMYYTSSGYVGDGYTDDFRVRKWCGSDPTVSVGEEEGSAVPALLQGYTVSLDGSTIEIVWTLGSDVVKSSFRLYRISERSAVFEEIIDPDIVQHDLTFVYRDDSIEPGETYRYRVELVCEDGQGTLLLETRDIEIPSGGLALYQNNPNPFNPSTTIRYCLPYEGAVTLVIYDTSGRRVVRLIDREKKSSGLHVVEWMGADENGSDVPSGVYFYKLQFGKSAISRKMLLLK